MQAIYQMAFLLLCLHTSLISFGVVSLSNKYGRFVSILSCSSSADVTVSVWFWKAFDLPLFHPKVHIVEVVISSRYEYDE